MKTLSSLKMVLTAVALLACSALAVAQEATADETAVETEDVIYMHDGRELHGKIVSEADDEIVFEFIDRVLGLRTKLRLDPADIARIQRDVAIDTVKTEASKPRPKKKSTKKRIATSRPLHEAEEEAGRRYGRSRTEHKGLDVTTVYRVPMRGQMGTDISKHIYEEVLEEIQSIKPDVIIFELNSSESPDLMIPQVEDPRESRGIMQIDQYLELVDMLKDDLPDDHRQVMWIKDSVGLSSMLALAWDEVYMSPEARFWGLRSVIDRTGAENWSDPDVRAKMEAAWGGSVKAFFEYGGYDMALADAMMWPDKILSASFKGRQVVFALNDTGEYIIDSDDEKTLGLRAKEAEDLLLSQGTVESIDDLTFLMGFREYREVGTGERIVEDYIEKWRKVYEQSKNTWEDYLQHRRWATGEDTVKYLGRAKGDLEKIIRSMEQYKAVEVRWQVDTGMTKMALEIEVEKLREQLRALKSRRRGGGYGGGTGGGGFGGGG